MLLLHFAFAASTITVSCCACLVVALKRAFRLECIEGQDVSSGVGMLRPINTALFFFVTLAFVAIAACLAKPLSNHARDVSAAVCSKWQPLYFVVVSLQRVFLRAIVIPYALGSWKNREASCAMSSNFENEFHAATLLWDGAMLSMGVSTICADLNANVSPSLRRFLHIILALCLLLDLVGSCMWGNDTASQVLLSVSGFRFLLDNQITSCIITQLVLALRFVFMGWRSRHGRGWYYASLRFELDLEGTTLLSRLTLQPRGQQPIAAGGSSLCAAVGGFIAKLLGRVQQGLLQFQLRSVSNCCVFVIPCVSINGNHDGSADCEFALARPAFDLKCLRLLHPFANAHPKLYFSFIFFFLAVPSLAVALFAKIEVRGVLTLVFNSAIVFVLLGFLSCNRYNIDRIAAKQAAISFRYAVFVVLLSQWIALDSRRAFLVLRDGHLSLYDRTPWDVAAVSILALMFSLCLLLDCSPHLPAFVQIFVTV
jgi:hypothetical protein